MSVAAPASLRILITNNTLSIRAGSELYVRDLAIALMRRGHKPVAYSTHLGDVAEELRKATVPVVDDLRDLKAAPDIIHGHHHLDAMTAMLRYPDVPAIFVCHGWAPWQSEPPAFPSIARYVAVDDLCRERLLTTEGIDPAKIEVLYNFVDLERFHPRESLPARPRSALIFSNAAGDAPWVHAIRRACARFGIERVDAVGAASGNSVARPETVLGNYDVVFAKARAALEALSCGCAVVVADTQGLGGMVTSQSVAELRALNFGARAMKKRLPTEENVLTALGDYDGTDAAEVRDWIREHCGIDQACERWIEIYRAVLSQSAPPNDDGEQLEAARRDAASTYLRGLAGILKTSQQARRQAEKARHGQALLQAELKARTAELEALRAAESRTLANKLQTLKRAFKKR